MSLKQAIYTDFSLGYNDTMASISITDKETAKSENIDYSTEVKALTTRKGCTKVNEVSFGDDATDAYSWIVGSTSKKCVVIDEAVYDFNVSTGEKTKKIDLTTGAKHIYPFVVYNKMYFGDGSELYVWGESDYNSEVGTKDILVGDIVKNNDSTGGVIGHFYKAKAAQTACNLLTETYTNTTNWTDVTDVRYFSSNVVRKVIPHDPSAAEVVLITITTASSAAGTLSLTLNGVTFTCTIAAGASVAIVVDALYNMTTSGWTKKKISNAVQFTRTTVGLSENGYFDPAATGVGATYQTTTEGKANDNDLSAIKKCTMFGVHTGSYRVFASGNPDDNAMYYGEIGQPVYFKSSINKLYPANGYGKLAGFCAISDSLLASYEMGWYAWTGITPLADATWKPINIPYGCACHYSIALTPESFTFLSYDGVYNVNAAILSSEYLLLQGKSVIKKLSESRVEKTIKSIDDKSMCRGIFFNNTYYLAFNTDGISNDRLLKYEWDTGSFTIATGWKVNSWLFDATNLYFASKNYVLKANDGYSDIDVETGLKKPINVDVITKAFTLGSPFSQKAAKFICLIFKQNDEEIANADIIVHMGYESVSFAGIDLAESLIWGREWGKTWGYRESITKMIELNRISDTFQLEIKNSNLDDPITLIAIGFIYEDVDFTMPNILKDEVLLR